MRLSNRTFIHLYVHIHDEEEHAKVKEALGKLGVDFEDTEMWEVAEHKRFCDNCGFEVRDHNEGECP